MAHIQMREVRELRTLVLEEKWHAVTQKYREDVKYHNMRIIGKGTALHVAIYNEDSQAVGGLIDEINKVDDKKCLEILDDKGATPLHLAARGGLIDVCELLIGKVGERKYLIEIPNAEGETPLFWAVGPHGPLVFLYLQQFDSYDNEKIPITNKNNTILHVAIQIEMFDLAIIIIHFYERLIAMRRKEDKTSPLEILATKKAAFQNLNSLSWWKTILYKSFAFMEHDAKKMMNLLSEKIVLTGNATKEEESINQVNIPIYSSASRIKKDYEFLEWGIMSLFDNLYFGEIRTIKKKHIYSRMLLNKFMEKPNVSYTAGGGDPYGDIDAIRYNLDEVPRDHTSMQDTSEESINDNAKSTEELNSKVPIDKKDTAYLIAASDGIIEMMSVLLSNIKSVMDETNSNNENALLLAVKNKQPHVIELLRNNKQKGLFDHLILQIDVKKNTMLHLAASASRKREITWRVSGVAMQMMWDIKWYKYIKQVVPDHFQNMRNSNKKTPSEIFKNTHKKILEESSTWITETSNSCSVVAALIAGVSFATSGSIPGGNQQTGEPTLKGQPAFEGFAISSLFGLYFSGTALIMFLSILTSRKEVEDFCISLPLKLLVGLSSLFVSIVSMFISFCAGHFFVLTDKYTQGVILFYLYISICLPVAVYGVVQFPLFLDLLNVIFKKVPPPSVKGVRL